MAKGKKTGGRAAGTPNKATGEAKDLARAYGPDAIKRAAEGAGLVKDEAGVIVGRYESESAQMMALNTILDRAYGKAPQALTGEGGEGPVELLVQWLSDGS